jgi:hypothetical protein
VIAELRRQFNNRWNPDRYQSLLELLEVRCGAPVGFRVSETPCFFPQSLFGQLAGVGAELIHQLSTPDYRRISDRAVPDRYRVPGEPDHPLFVQVDLGLQPDGTPKLVEIQGFPSLYAFQAALSQAYLDAYELPYLRYAFVDDYSGLLRRVIVGDRDPAEVVLLELDPAGQKTLPDFLATEKLLGVRPVCITRIRKSGNKLYDGDRPIRRIYNRTIIDELERRQVTIPFDWRDELDVEWAGHPNFYFRISKFSLPYLKHDCVPRTWFLHEVPEIPEDLAKHVLKPLYSFAGWGVRIGPDREEISRIGDPENWILQERVDFASVIDTPHGPTKAEIRIMYIWPSDATPQAVCSIVRMGRGRMMGVDHNRNMEWVGASAALYAS